MNAKLVLFVTFSACLMLEGSGREVSNKHDLVKRQSEERSCNDKYHRSACIEGCPSEGEVDGDCVRGVCCKQPLDDSLCTEVGGVCKRPSECTGMSYNLPWRCEGDSNRVCCVTPPAHLCSQDPDGMCVVDCPEDNIIPNGNCGDNEGHCCKEPTSEETCPLPGCCLKRNKCGPPNKYSLPWRCPNKADFVCCYPRNLTARGWKDPHMLTFSGTKYSFQGHCSYILVKDCRSDDPAFTIYADFRGRYNPTEPPTRMVAVSTTVRGYGTYTFREDHSVTFNGEPVYDRKFTIGDEIGRVIADDDRVILYLNEDEVFLEWIGKYHEAAVSIGNEEMSGSLCGMLGDGSPVQGEDLLMSDGTKTSRAQEFAESWLIPGSCV